MSAQPLRGVHVFWSIAAFFAVMIAIEAFFVTRAIATFPGEDEHNSYVQGLDFNRTLERREIQRQLGWKAQAGIEAGPTLVVRVEEASSRPISDLSVTARIRRAAHGRDEQSVELREGKPGEYSASLGALDGRLEVRLEARREAAGNVVFEAVKTLVVP